MRFFYSFLLIAAILPLNSCISQPKKIQTMEERYPFPAFDPSSVSPIPKIEKGCEAPPLEPTIKQKFRPDFPVSLMRREISGYVIFDFRINENGRVENIELVAEEPENIFRQNSSKSLENLIFSVANRSTACIKQKYRVAYPYHFMTKCAPNEFPADITTICVTGHVVKLN